MLIQKLIKNCRLGNYNNVADILEDKNKYNLIDDRNFHFAFHEACKNGNLKIVKLFLEHEKYSYNSEDYISNFITTKINPLVTSFKYDRRKITKYLLLNDKANKLFSIHDKDLHYSFIEYVFHHQDIELLQLLHTHDKLREKISFESNEKLLSYAAHTNLEIFKYIFERYSFEGLSRSAKNSLLTKSTYEALASKNQDIVYFLIKQGDEHKIPLQLNDIKFFNCLLRSNNFELFTFFDNKYGVIYENTKTESHITQHNTIKSIYRLNNIDIFKYILSKDYPLIKKYLNEIIVNSFILKRYDNLNYLFNDPIFRKSNDIKPFLNIALNFDLMRTGYTFSHFFSSLTKEDYKGTNILIDSFKKEKIPDWENKFLLNILHFKDFKFLKHFIDTYDFEISDYNIDYIKEVIDKEKNSALMRDFNQQAYELLISKKLYNKLNNNIKPKSSNERKHKL